MVNRCILKYFFNRYTAAAIAIQFMGLLAIWIIASISPAGVRFFRWLFYFYVPPIYLVSTVLDLGSEAGTIAVILYGMFLGAFIYGFIFGSVVLFIKERRSTK